MSRLLIIGSPRFTVDAIQFALRHGTGLSFIGVVDSSTDVAGEVRRARPDIVVVDGVTGGLRAPQYLSEIRAEAEAALLLVVVDDVTDAETMRTLDANAVICAWPGGVRQRIREDRQDAGNIRRLRIAGGSAVDPHRAPAALTARELETLGWVAEGHTNAWIARKLWVTERTVKFHLTNIYRKLGVANRTEASQYAIRHRLVSAPSASADAPDLARRTGHAPAVHG